MKNTNEQNRSPITINHGKDDYGKDDHGKYDYDDNVLYDDIFYDNRYPLQKRIIPH
jgi:hypothetical protein